MKLKTALLQTDPHWESVDKNLRTATEMIRHTEDASLVVLPEMFATGFSMNAPAIAEPADGKTVTWMREVSQISGKAIVGSVAVKESTDGETRYFNRLHFVKPDGTMHTYDKRHLFRMSGEHEVYTTGSERLVVEWEGFRIMPIVCYDIRFPVWCRNRGDYDVLIDVASWATPRREVWLTLLKARAIENVCYTIGVNRAGDDPDAHYSGDSIVYDFKGNIVTRAEEEDALVMFAELDKAPLEDFRTKFPVHLDADKFELL